MSKALRVLFCFLISLIAFLIFPSKAIAIYDPQTRPNNKFGIHLFFPSEINKSSDLINSSGGEWGYVTIPIQAGDKDLAKWQKFMDECRRNKIIPILRLATEVDHFNTKVWRKPSLSDVLDFSNFLSSLNWPTKNRYIIVFNEVNRADEWGGEVDPSEYAQALSYAVSAFKSNSQDFFIISSGMDNASVNTDIAMNEYSYFSLMNAAIPGIFNQIDGISSHSYPNPAFSQPPSFLSTRSIDTFYYEKRFIEGISSKKFPIFITETGWDAEKISASRVSAYYKEAFQNVWKDDYIIAVTPFVFSAQMGPFTKFSFLDTQQRPNEIYHSVASIQKIKGNPIVNTEDVVLASSHSSELPIKNYSSYNSKSGKMDKFENLINAILRF